MKKSFLNKVGMCGAVVSLASVLFLNDLNAQNIVVNEADYTVPSWTLYQRAVKAAKDELLVSKDMPYNVNSTINGDPTKQMGVTWFTNEGVKGGMLQLVKGSVEEADFSTPLRVIEASEMDVTDLNYNIAKNKLDVLAEYPNNLKKNYVSNKVLVDNLDPNTVYSYRVGKEGAWSQTGTFTTAKENKDEFTFIYITDTQAQYDEMFDVSKKTVATAGKYVPDAKFLLITGDLVETSGSTNSEWEWEQWFETMQSTWLSLPIVPVQGNHDTSANSNFYYHFNTNGGFNKAQENDNAKTAIDGTVYSFTYGDALFMVVNYEDYKKGDDYFEALEKWMQEQIDANSDLKWRIAAYHKTVYTGSKSHQDDGDGKIVRERMAPVYDRLGIDLAIQGHDHIYEVIGVLNGGQLVEGSIANQKFVEPNERENVTGIEGGEYNVNNGVLYFLNNSAGRKKYEPRTREQMDASIAKHGIEDYFDFFGKFGQTGEPTFSRVSVSSDVISITTYTVDDEGEATEFDSFTVVKNSSTTGVEKVRTSELKVYPNEAKDAILIETPYDIESVELYTLSGQTVLTQKNNSVNLSSVQDGVYLLKVQTTEATYSERFIVKK